MGHLFKKHYTRDEARALLPQIRQWLKQMCEARQRLFPSGRADEIGHDENERTPRHERERRLEENLEVGCRRARAWCSQGC